MTHNKVLIDTDILSMIMRKNKSALQVSRTYLSVYNKFTLSIITRYEILRGLKAKKATKQILAFDLFCKKCEIVPITEKIVCKASDIYAKLKEHGELIDDADILIAASAMVNGLGVVTNNEKHFKRIKGLKLENWL